jgi:prepilin-type N-terminal cleavage/methylation domain-containing protein
MLKNARAFTLIELLIVVAIIAILAAIAVPNFLEAQVRAKVARAKNDLRVVTTGLEAYYVDENKYPMMNASARMIHRPGDPATYITLERITTPIAYLSSRSVFADPFKAHGIYESTSANMSNPWTTREFGVLPDPESLKEYFYTARGINPNSTSGLVENLQWNDNGAKVAWYVLESAGPDGYHHYLGNILNAMTGTAEQNLAYIQQAFYDPTNGTASRGSVFRGGGSKIGRGSDILQGIAAANK